MRVVFAAAAFAVACLSVPAQATVFIVSIAGTVTGETQTYGCNGPQTICTAAFTKDIALNLGPVDLVEGENHLTRGGFYSNGETDFTIVRNGSFLTGIDMVYGFKSCSGVPPPGCRYDYGTARTFAVVGGVPEPATWAMMVLGFGAVGAAFRRRTVVQVQRCV